MYKERSILFLSANDFKEKSIQVIRKTPEAYVRSGWDVDYIVARDNSKNGNYFYEKEINPDGVNVTRFYAPFTKIKNKISNHLLRTIISKLSGYIIIIILVLKAYKKLRHKKYNVIYGYEVHGVLAVNILKLFRLIDKIKIISRFQGVFYINPILKNKNILKFILNWDQIVALRLSSDLSIMTNDGTQGDNVFRILKSKNLRNYRFWVNGVDRQIINDTVVNNIKHDLGLKDEFIFITISRLEDIKKIDRSIKAISILNEKYNFSNFKFLIVGEGKERTNLENLVKEKQLEKNVIFIGAIRNTEVKNYLYIADIFFSTFDSSNVGNPLLEAIRANKIIFTLNNGDTSQWINHKENGFIYDINHELYENMAKDINELLKDKKLIAKITANIKITENEKLWTWDERMTAEIKEVKKLLDENIK